MTDDDRLRAAYDAGRAHARGGAPSAFCNLHLDAEARYPLADERDAFVSGYVVERVHQRGGLYFPQARQ